MLWIVNKYSSKRIVHFKRFMVESAYFSKLNDKVKNEDANDF
jgi:hypothetical protein